MKFTIEHEREEDGRWLAGVPELAGVLAYGATANEAMAKAEVLALRVWRNAWNTAKTGRSPSQSPSLRHDRVAFVEGAACALGVTPDWLDA